MRTKSVSNSKDYFNIDIVSVTELFIYFKINYHFIYSLLFSEGSIFFKVINRGCINVG